MPNIFDEHVAQRHNVFDTYKETGKAPQVNPFDAFAADKEPKSLVRQVADEFVGAGEAALTVLGGFADFINPVPGAAGIAAISKESSSDFGVEHYEEVAAGSPYGASLFALDSDFDPDRATEVIHRLQEQTRSIISEPRTPRGKVASERIGKAMDFLVVTPARTMGEVTQDVTGSPLLATAVNTTAELAGFSALFGGLGRIRGKIAKGEKLTKLEQTKFDEYMEDVANSLEHQVEKKAELTGERPKTILRKGGGKKKSKDVILRKGAGKARSTQDILNKFYTKKFPDEGAFKGFEDKIGLISNMVEGQFRDALLDKSTKNPLQTLREAISGKSLLKNKTTEVTDGILAAHIRLLKTTKGSEVTQMIGKEKATDLFAWADKKLGTPKPKKIGSKRLDRQQDLAVKEKADRINEKAERAEDTVDVVKEIPEKLEGDVQAGSLAFGQALPKKALSLNLKKISEDYPIQKLLVDMSDLYKGQIQAERGGKVSYKVTRELATLNSMTTKKLLTKRGKGFTDAEALASRDLLLTSAEELHTLHRNFVETGSDEALARFVLAREIHADIQSVVTGIGTARGRALNALKIQAARSKQLTKNYKAMLDELGGREFNEEINRRFAQIDPTNQVAVNTFIREVSKATTTDMIFEAWVNGLLSSPITHLVNTVSNSLVFLSKPLEEISAATIDFTRSKVTNTPRERFFGETPQHVFGIWRGFPEGVRKGLEAFVTEIPSQGRSKLEIGKQQAIPGLAGKTIRVPGRALLMMDEFFKAVNYQAELHSLAYRQSVKEGHVGKARGERIADIISKPSEELHLKATEEMLYRVFQKELGATGNVLQKLRQTNPVAKWIVPFLRTPINIMKFGLERTPLNFPRIIRKTRKGDLKAGELSDELAKATFGSIVSATIAIQYMEGKVTGGGPKDPKERAALYRSNWQPYSIKVGDEYWSYARLEPLGTILGITADFMEIYETMSSGERDDIAAKIGLSIGQNLINKTFMRGLSDAMNAISDPERYGGRWTERFMGTGVPRGVAFVTRELDPVLRTPNSIADIYKAQLPGLSKSVIPKRDLWGEPITLSTGVLKRKKFKSDKIDAEMVRLKIFPSLPRDEIQDVKLTPEQYDWLIEKSGKETKKILDMKVNASNYDGKKDIAKESQIRAIISGVRDKYRGILTSQIRDAVKKAKRVDKNK